MDKDSLLLAGLEQERQVRRQKTQSTVAAVTIASLTLVLIALVMALISIVIDKPKQERVVAYNPVNQPDAKPEKRQMPNQPKSKPSSPASASSPAITSRALSPVAIQTPDIEVFEPTLGTGLDGDFGTGWDDGSGSGAGRSTTGWGTPGRQSNALVGRFYDFKQDRRGRPNSDYEAAPRRQYVENVRSLHRRKFSDGALRSFFKAGSELSSTQIAIPFSSASEGPRFFGVEDEVKPSGWMVHYSGKVRVPRDGRYRFVGMGDDYLSVLVDRKVRLVACWSDIQKAVAGSWEPGEQSHQWPSPLGAAKLVTGDWMDLREGQVIDLDIGLGERPGGKVGFVLLLQREGEAYRQDASGRPILPLFATSLFSAETMEQIERGFGSFLIGWDKPLVFPVVN